MYPEPVCVILEDYQTFPGEGMELTHDLVRKFSGSALFARGMDYYKDGRVLSVSWIRGGVTASVQGSRKRPYVVSAGVEYGHPVLSCSCSSGWGGVCHHGVAVLLYLCDHGGLADEGVQKPKRSLPVTGRTERGGREDGLAEYLSSACEPPRVQLYFSFREESWQSGRALPLALVIVFRGGSQKISGITPLLDPCWRTALAGLPAGGILSGAQRSFLVLLERLLGKGSAGVSSARLRLPIGHFVSLLESLGQGNEVDIVDAATGQVLAVRPQPLVGLKVILRRQTEGGLTVRAVLSDPLQPAVSAQAGDLLPGHPLWIIDRKALCCRRLHPQIDRQFLEYFLEQERMLQKNDALRFMGGVLAGLKSFAELDTDDPQVTGVRVENCALSLRYEVDVCRSGLAVNLVYEYAGLVAGNDEDFVEGRGVIFRRDRQAEQHAAQQLVQDFGMFSDENTGRFHLSGAEAIFDFLSVRSAELSVRGQVVFSEGVREIYRSGELLQPRIMVKGTGIDWFSYDITFVNGDERVDVPAEVVQECLQSGRHFLRTKTGKFLALDQAALLQVAQVLAGRVRNGGMMAAHVPGAMEELSAAGVVCDADESARRISEAFKGEAGIENVDLPAGLEGVLRHYQQHGVNWILFLRKFRFGGILADEMGLGKTLQALTAIRCAMVAGEALPSLIVCPTTLVWNWEAEVRKFFPDLVPLVISGLDRREKIARIGPASIVITSYALLRRDIDYYQKQGFNMLILDEAQNIKNRHTINARVVRCLQAQQRLALTGTPLENGIADIWSLYDFLMPGFLGGYEHFRTGFEVPIMQEHDREKLQLLARRISPFVLRRMKQDVISEIPEKIEQVSFCELEPAQAKVYAEMADRARSSALAAVKRRGFRQSRMLILTLILRLRQICCHPELAGFRFGHRTGISAKTDLFRETLGELLSSGHRVLVFSQFVGMLAILRDYLEKEKISFEYMDGKSRNRGERVRRFNEDKSLQVFLLSLKVGGLGLNLTSADTVILYEPWWNPAVEQQAIDRVHRIGQKNSVLAYRLIARGTIEEKIMELQQRKKSLLGSLVLADEGVAKKMDWEDIRFLLDIK